MKIVFLGTGGTYPSKHRNVMSIALQMPGEVVMFDCGEGTQRQLMFSSVSFMRIKSIFITHLHADHFLGLAGLVQSMSLNGREEDLVVYGPHGTGETVRSMLSLGHFKCAYRVTAKDLRPDETIDFGTYFVRCASADHTVPALAYALEEKRRPGKFNLKAAKMLGIPEGPLYRKLQEGKTVKVGERSITPDMVLGPGRRGRKVVFTGDTRPSQEIVKLAMGADVLVHDCTLDSQHADLAWEFGHSTAAEAAEVAREAGVHVLFLVHMSPRYDSTTILEKEAREVFPNSKIADELSEYTVRFRE